MTGGDGEPAVPNASSYWDTLAPHHWRLEDNYLNVSSVRLILGDIRQPVMVVGAGQGLIVEELRRQGLRCDGIDLSAEMMEYARLRRGLTLVRANATAMPFVDGTYETVIVATGVIDFMADVQQIETILREVRIPTDSDHRFRFIPITDSDGFRSVIPIDPDHLGVNE